MAVVVCTASIMIDSINALYGDQVTIDDVYDPVSADAQAMIIASMESIRWVRI